MGLDEVHPLRDGVQGELDDETPSKEGNLSCDEACWLSKAAITEGQENASKSSTTEVCKSTSGDENSLRKDERLHQKIFSLSRKAKNKFIHALNGNTTSAVWSSPALVFGLMKQLCLLAAGNPDAGRDDSGKKIDGLTWISPERALRMFDRLIAPFFMKARNDDGKKIDGSSKLRSAVQRCAQFARVGIELGRTYSGVETCEGTSESFVGTICLSRKARNKFIHAMNGNTVDTKGRETAARKATTNVNKKWITFLAEMIDYDKKKALAILANGKTNLRELMDEIKVAKTSENQKAILDKYHEAGRRKRQESGKQSRTVKTRRRKRGVTPQQTRQ